MIKNTVSEQPLDLHYQPTKLTLQLPSVSIISKIVQIPFIDGNYPVEWLGEDVGMLEGSDLPGKGITVIVGHNHLDAEISGPFALLKDMQVGDTIFLTDSHNQISLYTVYANEKIANDDAAALEKIASAYNQSITLLTCEDEGQDGIYTSRRVVSARLKEMD